MHSAIACITSDPNYIPATDIIEATAVSKSSNVVMSSSASHLSSKTLTN